VPLFNVEPGLQSRRTSIPNASSAVVNGER
jgi:hypothetical protein